MKSIGYIELQNVIKLSQISIKQNGGDRTVLYTYWSQLIILRTVAVLVGVFLHMPEANIFSHNVFLK